MSEPQAKLPGEPPRRHRRRRKQKTFFEEQVGAAGSRRFKKNVAVASYVIASAIVFFYLLRSSMESDYTALVTSTASSKKYPLFGLGFVPLYWPHKIAGKALSLMSPATVPASPSQMLLGAARGCLKPLV